ncbi:MAG: HD domain-containing protein [Planctomycetes bacterium]|nr:HD domain-containing protein [Planctomycetota bacterium]
MDETQKIYFKELVYGISKALDLLTLRISRHSQRVTMISLKMAGVMGISDSDKLNLFYAGLLHDFGVVSSKDKMDIMNFDYANSRTHIESGIKILGAFKLFDNFINIINYHHDHWLGPNQSGLIKDKIPVLSQILHLADRVEVLIAEDKYILEQTDRITSQVNKFSGMWFNSDLVDVFHKIARHEVFWLDLSTEFTSNILQKISPLDDRLLTLDEVIEIAALFAYLIDQKSRYTKTHCCGGTELAVKLGAKMGWSEIDLKQLKAAALLHDLGKLAVPDEILEKPSKLSSYEYAIIKKHAYYTYHILNNINGLNTIAQWASYHHEGLDGRGYPFGLKADEIPQGARIIAVADRFTALNEDRPYRRKLPPDQVLRILESEVKHNIIDSQIFESLKSILADNKH